MQLFGQLEIWSTKEKPSAFCVREFLLLKLLQMEPSLGSGAGMNKSPAARSISRRRERNGERAPALGAASYSIASPSLALSFILAVFTPRSADGFFRPSTRVKAPPPGPRSLSTLPQNREQLSPPSLFPIQPQAGASPDAVSKRFPSLLMSGAEEAGDLDGGDEQVVEADEEAEEEGIGMPSIEMPEMMSDQVWWKSSFLVCLWAGGGERGAVLGFIMTFS